MLLDFLDSNSAFSISSASLSSLIFLETMLSSAAKPSNAILTNANLFFCSLNVLISACN